MSRKSRWRIKEKNEKGDERQGNMVGNMVSKEAREWDKKVSSDNERGEKGVLRGGSGIKRER